MASNDTGGSLIPSFRDAINSELKARGLIPMTTGVTRSAPAHSDSYFQLLTDTLADVDRTTAEFSTRALDRYSNDVGSSYRDERYKLISGFENVRTEMYMDGSRPAIGLGFNFDRPNSKTLWKQAIGDAVSYEDARAGKVSITPSQAKALFDHDIMYFEKVVDRAAAGRKLTQNQRLALVSVAYTSPKRISDNASIIATGSNEQIMDFILHNSFDPNHPQKEGLKKRRYAEASLFGSLTESGQKMPTAGEYLTLFDPDAPKPAEGTTNLAQLSYTNQGALRNLPVKKELERAIQEGVTAVYGADYKVEVMSGAMGEHGGKKSRGVTGSYRHGTEAAADVWVYDPSGKRLTGDALLPLSQHWLATKQGSVGFPAKQGQSLHLDLVGGSGPGAVPRPKGGALWYYGAPSASQKAALDAAVNGTAPKYALSLDVVRKGLVPPGSIPEVGSELAVDPTAPNPLSRQAGTRARTKAAVSELGLIDPSKVAPIPLDVENRITARNNNTWRNDGKPFWMSVSAPTPLPSANGMRARANAAGLMFVKTGKAERIRQISDSRYYGTSKASPIAMRAQQQSSGSIRTDVGASHVSDISGGNGGGVPKAVLESMAKRGY